MSVEREQLPIDTRTLSSGVPVIVARGSSPTVTTVTLWVRSTMPTRYGLDAARWLATALTNERLSEEVLSAQKSVIIEELRGAADDPMDRVHDVFFEAMFAGAALGRPVGGTIDTVAALSADAVRLHQQERVHAGTIGVIAAGGLTADELTRALDDGPLGALEHEAWLPHPEQPHDSPREPVTRRSVDSPNSYAALVLGGRAAAVSDPERVAYEVLPMLIAGTGTSLLFREVRSKRGLAYDVWGRFDAYRDIGAWRVSIGTSPENLEKVVGIAQELLCERAEGAWPAREIATAKRQAAGLIELEAETSAGVAVLLGRNRWLAQDWDWSLHGHVEAIEALRPDDVAGAYRAAMDHLVVATVAGARAEEGVRE
jgi:predicted Zn-dependent peptidase